MAFDSIGRDALYAALPFVAVGGMQNRERSLKRTLSSISVMPSSDVSYTYVLILDANRLFLPFRRIVLRL